MLSASTAMVGWFSSVQYLGDSEPLWFVVWGAALLAAATLFRSLGDRPQPRP